MKKIFCILTVVVLIFAFSVTSFAYFPIVQVVSSDWNIVSSYTQRAVYPNRTITNNGLTDDVFSYTELKGETYYYSVNDVDDFPWISETEISIPEFNFDISGCAFGNESTDYVVFASGNDIYVAFLYEGLSLVYFSQNTKQVSFYMDRISEVDVYKSSYPFTSWIFLNYFDWYGDSSDTYELEVNEFGIGECEIIWSSVDILEPVTDACVYEADTIELSEVRYIIEYEKPISAFKGETSFDISYDDLVFLSSGACAVSIDNFGFIFGTLSCFYSCQMTVSIWNEVDEILIDEIVLSDSDTGEFLVGESYFDNYIIFTEFNYDPDVVADKYLVELDFVFASDGFNLFFPGTFEIIEFESYEDDMEHDEVMNAIDEATGIISGSISNASSDLSQEIVDAAEGINDSIDSQTEIISDKLDEVSNSIDDASQNITDKLEETKNSLLDGIKGFFIPSDEAMEDIDKQWDELLKTRFGALYEVSDIISEFGSNLTWEYIQTAGEKNTITMPEVTVNFSDTPFSFGGYEVSIIPDGFDVLVTAVKGITSIVCTFLFINSLRNKYEKLIGGTAA